jgi:two-component system phosphate regulon sensor histidine kinase PhoR
MTARIFFKLIAAVLLVMVVALTAIDFLASGMAERAYVDTLTREMTEKVRMLRVVIDRAEVPLSAEHALALAHASACRLTLVAPDGRVLVDSEAEAAQMENHGHRPEVRRALDGSIGVSVRRSPTIGVNFLYVAGPVKAGAMRLAMPLREIHGQIAAVRLRLLSYTALVLVPAILLAGFFARYFSSRLGAIIDYASTLATGNFQARLPYAGNNELGVLSRQLNETAENLQRMFQALEREHVELEKLERIRKDFVINVSHELRTPLASIQGYTETLLDGALEDKDNNVRFLNIIRQNAERLGRLTADLLTLSRIELKTQRFQFAAYYLRPLLEECVDSLRPVAEKKNIAVHLRIDDNLLEVFCDAEAVRQIMGNLLDNAIKYTPENGEIFVTARRIEGPPEKGEMVETIVRDTGMGIPADDLPRLFERFYRVDKARSRELGGTGLGLAIVKHLVRAQGGEIHVESMPNVGSSFCFSLPTQDLGLHEEGTIQAGLTA